jgi:hypothetical protein
MVCNVREIMAGCLQVRAGTGSGASQILRPSASQEAAHIQEAGLRTQWSQRESQ